ncbi:hypothetical protein M3215_11625 [Bacillus cytotoxicus]|uniref:Uncharacterized protein n=1 Tax=Bacillus cytotoxicus TaxID=580165 RepID=A0ACC6A7A4_9BACI|nr:hypothetical protein [Bacillus cytotoxicus]
MFTLFNYIRTQYILKKFSKEDLTHLVSLNRITSEERIAIIRTLEPEYTE